MFLTWMSMLNEKFILPQMNLRFYFNGGKHMHMDEYHTYATYSFIADIGGYLVIYILMLYIS